MPGAVPREAAAGRRLTGVGVAARGAHVPDLLQRRVSLDFLELLADNHLAAGGPARAQAHALAERYPIALHCVGMSLGSVDALDRPYLRRVRRLADETGAVHVSDHIAFTRVDGVEFHDLLPLPGTRAALAHLVARVLEAQERLGRRLLLENPSRYLPDVAHAMPEAEFVRELCRRSGCGLLLDLNNLYVSRHNIGADALMAIESLPVEAVGYVHIAGHARHGGLLVDTHGAAVADAVWALLGALAGRIPGVPVVVERDRNLPPLRELLAEAERARAIVGQPRRHAA
jgi:uncharacterized protein (UPF0276 family)